MLGQRKYCQAVLVVLMVILSCRPAAGQSTQPAEDQGLLPLIPEQAVFFVERRGHEAVGEAFRASNLGKMAADEAIHQFVHDSRVRIGRMIVSKIFDLSDPGEITRHQELLHGFLKPFWYRPCAMFVVLKEGNRGPALGFMSLPGAYQQECKEALEALMKVGVPPKGRPGLRQAFTYSSGVMQWQGVAKGSEEFELPADGAKQIEMLRQQSLFMVCWMHPMLCVATDLSAADALAGAWGVSGEKGKSKHSNESLRRVMSRTALKDWAFRWFVDAEMLLRTAGSVDGDVRRMLQALGVDKIRGVGGTGGYADGVYTRMTYIDAPGLVGGPAGNGQSYKQALAMMPSESTFLLAGKLPKEWALRALTVAMGGGAQGPATGSAPAVSGESARTLKQIELLAEASGGNAGIFVTDLQAVMAMFGGAGAPVGAVLDLKDRDKAVKAIEELIELHGGPGVETAPEEGLAASPREYRKVPIRYMGDWGRIAVLEDRVILALGDNAMKAAIDTALDKTGGFEPGGEAERLAALAGEGSAIFKMDLPAIVRLCWPMLMQFTAMEGMSDGFPLASLPSTDKMARMLGPEIAVFQADKGGLLLKSRGKVPFATKAPLCFPFMGFFFYWML